MSTRISSIQRNDCAHLLKLTSKLRQIKIDLNPFRPQPETKYGLRIFFSFSGFKKIKFKLMMAYVEQNDANHMQSNILQFLIL